MTLQHLTELVTEARILALAELLGGPIEPQIGEPVTFEVHIGMQRTHYSMPITQSDMTTAWGIYNAERADRPLRDWDLEGKDAKIVP